MKGPADLKSASAGTFPKGADADAYSLEPFILGLCEALGPDAPLRRVVFLTVLWQAEQYGITSQELERRVKVMVGAAQSTTSRTVRLLSQAGLVESFICPRDRRSCLIRLTGVGRVVLRNLAGIGVPGDGSPKPEAVSPSAPGKSVTSAIKTKATWALTPDTAPMEQIERRSNVQRRTTSRPGFAVGGD